MDSNLAEPIFEIEKKHPELYELSYSGLKVWTLLRFILRIHAAIPKKRRVLDISKRVQLFRISITVLVKTIVLILNPAKVFGRYNVVVFTNRFEKRVLQGKAVDKLSSGIIEYYEKAGKRVLVINYGDGPVRFSSSNMLNGVLLMELVRFFYPSFLHKRQARNISAKLMGSGIVTDGKAVIDELDHYAGIFGLYTRLYRIWKPEFVYMPDYSCFAEVYAANKLGIETIELQHGNINQYHPGYIAFSPIDRGFYCNRILLFGMNSKVNAPQFVYRENQMHVIGNYYLSRVVDTTPSEAIARLKPAFGRTVCLPYDITDEKFIFTFIVESVKRFTDTLFVFSVRYSVPESLSKLAAESANVYIECRIPFQELVRSCDFNMCSFSTCALEALALGKPNILLTHDPRTKKYYSGKLDTRFSFFIETIDELETILRADYVFDPSEIKLSNTENIATNYDQNLQRFIQDYAWDKTMLFQEQLEILQ